MKYTKGLREDAVGSRIFAATEALKDLRLAYGIASKLLAMRAHRDVTTIAAQRRVHIGFDEVTSRIEAAHEVYAKALLAVLQCEQTLAELGLPGAVILSEEGHLLEFPGAGFLDALPSEIPEPFVQAAAQIIAGLVDNG